MKERWWIFTSGFVFVLVWLAGLIIAPSSPGANASIVEVSSYYRSHQQSQLVQTFLVDGVAGIALLAFTAGLHSLFQRSGLETQILSNILFGAGLAAASISLIQAALGEALANRGLLAIGNSDTIFAIFVLLNAADTFKLLALSLLIAAAVVLTFRAGILPRWLGWVGVVLSVTLILGGLSFVLSSSALYMLLYAALPLLLLWVAAVSLVSLRFAGDLS